MALYQVAQERLMLPVKYMEDTGEPAVHDTPDIELAVDERGKPRRVYFVAYQGQYIYTAKSDYAKMTDEQKENSLFCDHKAAIGRFVGKEDGITALSQSFNPPLREVKLSSTKVHTNDGTKE